MVLEFAPDDYRTTCSNFLRAAAPFRWHRSDFWLWHNSSLASLNVANIEVCMERVVWPRLPCPDIDAPALRDRRIRQAHSKSTYSPTVLKVGAVSELQGEAQSASVHSFAVIKYGDFYNATPLPLMDDDTAFNAEYLHEFGIGLN
jgi:hypothetical protein